MEQRVDLARIGDLVSADEILLVQWLLWNVRAGDLPADVAAAAHRVVATGNYTRPDTVGRYLDRPIRVSVFPRDETQPLETRLMFRGRAGRAVDDALNRHGDQVAYILVDDVSYQPDENL